MMRRLKQIYRKQEGITGLETAIILIAFVVVAAVFAYTVLSAGLFSTQKSQEAVYSGLEETQSTMEMRGSVVGYNSTLNTNNAIGKVEFTVSLASANGEVIDLTPPYAVVGNTLTASGLENPMQIAYSDSAVHISNCAWTLSFIGYDDGDYDLESSEKAIITVWLHAYSGGTWANGTDPFLASNYVATNHTFTLEVKPSKGAVLTVERTTPAYLDTINDMH